MTDLAALDLPPAPNEGVVARRFAAGARGKWLGVETLKGEAEPEHGSGQKCLAPTLAHVTALLSKYSKCA